MGYYELWARDSEYKGQEIANITQLQVSMILSCFIIFVSHSTNLVG